MFASACHVEESAVVVQLYPAQDAVCRYPVRALGEHALPIDGEDERLAVGILLPNEPDRPQADVLLLAADGDTIDLQRELERVQIVVTQTIWIPQADMLQRECALK